MSSLLALPAASAALIALTVAGVIAADRWQRRTARRRDAVAAEAAAWVEELRPTTPGRHRAQPRREWRAEAWAALRARPVVAPVVEPAPAVRELEAA